jgi:hypothetical protein
VIVHVQIKIYTLETWICQEEKESATTCVSCFVFNFFYNSLAFLFFLMLQRDWSNYIINWVLRCHMGKS